MGEEVIGRRVREREGRRYRSKGRDVSGWTCEERLPV